MSQHAYIETGLSVLEARLRSPQEGRVTSRVQARPFITFGHETAAGASTVGHLLVPLLDQSFREAGQGWVFLDKNLLAHVLATHNLPERFVDFLPEDKISEIKAAIGELVGLHPSLWDLEQKVSEAILQMAHLGHVIIIGRAAYLITQSVPCGFRVRITASTEVRIERVMQMLQCDAEMAARHVRDTDNARRRFVRTRFGQDIDDPHLYDLVINTDRMTPIVSARLIVDALRARMLDMEGECRTGSTPPLAVPAEHLEQRNNS
jgi:cytidylate kinase